MAIEIPSTVRGQIAEVQTMLKGLHERISWAKPANIHLTLKFLGNVDEKMIPGIRQSLADSISDNRPFTVSVGGMGAFPNLRRARVLWVGVHDSNQTLTALAKSIDAALIPLGFSEENRKFTPHLTLGRVKSQLGAAFIQEFKQMSFAPVDVVVKEVVIMQSVLQPAGAVYTVLRRLRLA